MNAGLIHTELRRVRAGCVHLFAQVYKLPAERQAELEGQVLAVDYHSHDASGVRLRPQGGAPDCWATWTANDLARLPAPKSAAGLVREYRKTENQIADFVRQNGRANP